MVYALSPKCSADRTVAFLGKAAEGNDSNRIKSAPSGLNELLYGDYTFLNDGSMYRKHAV